jgi:hypothetical protein
MEFYFMDYNNNIFDQWHLENPWTLPRHADPKFNLKTLSTKEKVISVAILILTLPFAIIGGLCAFYGITAYFKEKMISNISLQSASPPSTSAGKVDEIKKTILSEGSSSPASNGNFSSSSKVEKKSPKPTTASTPKVNDLKLSKPKDKHLPSDLDLKTLSEDHIRKMSPDEQGELIDRYARRKVNGPSDLNKQQLRAMINLNEPGSIKLINAQEIGKGHCGRYCINNALQKEVLTQQEFLTSTAKAFEQYLGMSKEEADSLVNNDNDGIDVEIVAFIMENQFGIKTKNAVIQELPDVSASKHHSIEQFIGNADYVIVGNTGNIIYEMPSLGAPYPLAAGHFVAMRKDDKGKWWYLDSRANKPTCISLALIPKTCTIIAPQCESP